MKRNKKPLLVLVLLFSVAGALLVNPSTGEAQRRAWVDLNGDGVPDPGEEVIAPPNLRSALLTPRPQAVGDGVTPDHDALQFTINRGLRLLHHTDVDSDGDGDTDDDDVNWDVMEVTIDLEGLTYRFDSPLTINLPYTRTSTAAVKTRLRIINGTLLSALSTDVDGRAEFSEIPAISIYPEEPSVWTDGFAEYPEVTLEHVRLQNQQGTNFTGIQIERGLRCSFLNCAIEERNTPDGSRGYARGLVLRGAQMCSFIDCHFSGNSNHVVFEELDTTGDDVGDTPNTDCRFYACTFTESTGSTEHSDDRDEEFAGVGIVSKGAASSNSVTAAQCLFDGCSIETAEISNGGDAVSLVSLKDTRNMKFRACRFENGNGSNTAPLVLLGTGDGEESSDARFIDCNFSGDEYQDGYCIEGGSDVTGTALIANVFPSNDTYTPVSLSEGYSAVANTYLGDQELVNTATLDPVVSTYTIDWTAKVHHLTMTADCDFDVSLVDGRSVTVLLEGSGYALTWDNGASVLWEEGAEPTYSPPMLYTFTQIGGSIYGSARSSFAVDP